MVLLNTPRLCAPVLSDRPLRQGAMPAQFTRPISLPSLDTAFATGGLAVGFIA